MRESQLSKERFPCSAEEEEEEEEKENCTKERKEERKLLRKSTVLMLHSNIVILILILMNRKYNIYLQAHEENPKKKQYQHNNFCVAKIFSPTCRESRPGNSKHGGFCRIGMVPQFFLNYCY